MDNGFAFESLDAYKFSRELVKDVYSLLRTFPKEEQYALCDQLRRAVVSVPSNIAEGMTRTSNKEKAHFIEISYGSLMEVYCQLQLATDLGYISESQLFERKGHIQHISRLLSGLRNKFER